MKEVSVPMVDHPNVTHCHKNPGRADFFCLTSMVRQVLPWPHGAFVEPDISQDVWALAKKHKVATVLAPAILRSPLCMVLHPEARRVLYQSALAVAYCVRQWDEARRFLRSENIVVAELKGMVLARDVYAVKGQRSFQDVDILVQARDLIRLNDCLLDHGFTLQKTRGRFVRGFVCKGDPVKAAAHGLEDVTYEKDGLAVECHTVLLPPILGTYPTIRDWTTKEALEPEDFFVHLLFHATRHHFDCGLRHLLDLALWARHKSLDMDLVVRRISQTQLWFLAWPAWKLAAEYFPEVLPHPPDVSNHWIARYTDRVRSRFHHMPDISPQLHFSPLPFLVMKQHRLQTLKQVIVSPPPWREYQAALKESWIAHCMWIVRRPWGLLWRHAPSFWKWASFLYNPIRASNKFTNRRPISVTSGRSARRRLTCQPRA